MNMLLRTSADPEALAKYPWGLWLVGAPPSNQGLALICRRIRRLSLLCGSETLGAVGNLLQTALDSFDDESIRENAFTLSRDSRFGRLSKPEDDDRHPFRRVCMTPAPLWTVLAVRAPRACRDEWQRVLCVVAEAAINLQWARFDDGPQTLKPKDGIFGRNQSAVEKACRSLRTIAAIGAFDLQGVRYVAGQLHQGLCGQLEAKAASSSSDSRDRVSQIISLLRLAQGLRKYGHGGKSGPRGNKEGTDDGGPADEPQTPIGVTNPWPYLRPTVEVEGYSMWETEPDDDQYPAAISWRLSRTQAEIAELDAAPDEFAVDPVLLVERPCDEPEPIATVFAKALGRKRALARQAIASRTSLRELTPKEEASVRKALENPPKPQSPEFPNWFVGAAVALSGRAEAVHCVPDTEEPTSVHSVVFRMGPREWVVFSPHPKYQLPIEGHQLLQSRAVSTSLLLPGLSWLTPHAIEHWTRSGKQQLAPMVRGVLDHFGLEGRRTLSALTRPLALAIRDLSGDGVDIGLITGDMPRDGRTQAYYTTRTTAYLAGLHVNALEHAFGIRVRDERPYVHSTGFHGAFRCPTEDAVEGLIRQLLSDLSASIGTGDIIMHHNILTTYVAVAISIGIAGRSVIDPAPDAISITELLFVLSDKDSGSDYHTRAGPIPQLIASLIQGYRRHRWSICMRMGINAGVDLPFLFLLDESRTPRPFRPSDLKAFAPQFALPINALRRWVRTRLVEAGVGPCLVDAYLSHWVLGREAWHQYSGLSPWDVERVLIPRIDQLMSGVGVTVPHGYIA